MHRFTLVDQFTSENCFLQFNRSVHASNAMFNPKGKFAVLPRMRMRSKGSSGCSWSGLMCCINCAKKNLGSILTFRSPFQHRKEFNGFQYSLAAREVFVALTNPVNSYCTNIH